MKFSVMLVKTIIYEEVIVEADTKEEGYTKAQAVIFGKTGDKTGDKYLDESHLDKSEIFEG